MDLHEYVLITFYDEEYVMYVMLKTIVLIFINVTITSQL